MDRRARRSRDRLGDALVELMQEKAFEAITVQEVLDRAKVGRSTFYAHFRDKDDLFLSDADEFLEAMARGLHHHPSAGERVAPVAEMFAHVGEMAKLRAALTEAGLMPGFLDLAQEHFARGIEGRLAELPRARAAPPAERAAEAQALAGAMLALMTWWLARGMPLPAATMDDLFHRIVWSGIAAARPEPR